ALDIGLLDDARDIAQATAIRDNKLSTTLPDIALAMLKMRNEDEVIFAVWDAQRDLIAGDARLLAAAPVLDDKEFKFSNAHVGKHSRRQILLRSQRDGHAFYVAVAQTTGAMVHIQRSLFTSVFIFGMALSAVALIGVYFGVRTGLRPVVDLRNEIGSRSPSNLTPLQENLAPRELQPIARNLNALMKRLEYALSSHRRFIADAAHQLRTPLAALNAQIEVAQQLPAAEAHSALTQLAETAQRATHLTHQLLSLARLEHTELPAAQMESIELQDFFGKLLPEFVVNAENSGIELDFDIEACRVRGNRILLQELLSNLLDNALHYVPRGGHVHTQARVTAGRLNISIVDDGPGVGDAMREKLGTPFFRATADNTTGCGLGLAIACEIVRLHGGSIHFLQATEQGGLRIDINLPADETHHQSVTAHH
ncbi:MAG TPA: ATP-binding protein, partial [Spongiibacteraceae bacterium]|nr:ATP-binding protein [Spongiibacteraceae bacterium]